MVPFSFKIESCWIKHFCYIVFFLLYVKYSREKIEHPNGNHWMAFIQYLTGHLYTTAHLYSSYFFNTCATHCKNYGYSVSIHLIRIYELPQITIKGVWWFVVLQIPSLVKF